MKNINDLLAQDEPEEIKQEDAVELEAIYITEYAFEKAYAYAKLVCKKARGTMECGGYLIAPKESKDRIVTDAFLAKNQDVSGGLFTIYPEDVIKAGREINESGNKVLGWWHSHGFLDTFFSSTDDNGQMTVLNEINSFNYISKKKETKIDNLQIVNENGKTIVFDKENPERRYVFNSNNGLSLPITEFRIEQEKRIGFAYGLVVNAKNKKPYAEIATRELCGFCKTSEDKSKVVDITLFDNGEFKIDYDALRDEIKDRVKMQMKFFKVFSKGKCFSKNNSGQPAYRNIYGAFGNITEFSYEGQTFYPTNPPTEVPIESSPIPPSPPIETSSTIPADESDNKKGGKKQPKK